MSESVSELESRINALIQTSSQCTNEVLDFKKSVEYKKELESIVNKFPFEENSEIYAQFLTGGVMNIANDRMQGQDLAKFYLGAKTLVRNLWNNTASPYFPFVIACEELVHCVCLSEDCLPQIEPQVSRSLNDEQKQEMIETSFNLANLYMHTFLNKTRDSVILTSSIQDWVTWINKIGTRIENTLPNSTDSLKIIIEKFQEI
jgi:hypothetical protein